MNRIHSTYYPGARHPKPTDAQMAALDRAVPEVDARMWRRIRAVFGWMFVTVAFVKRLFTGGRED